MTEKHCPDCGMTQLFITPPCEDGHGDCIDLACIECGFAVTGLQVDLQQHEVLAA